MHNSNTWCTRRATVSAENCGLRSRDCRVSVNLLLESPAGCVFVYISFSRLSAFIGRQQIALSCQVSPDASPSRPEMQRAVQTPKLLCWSEAFAACARCTLSKCKSDFAISKPVHDYAAPVAFAASAADDLPAGTASAAAATAAGCASPWPACFFAADLASSFTAK